MDFAKFWVSEDVDVPDRFGAPARLRVWGASNDDEADARRAAETRAQKLLAFFGDPGRRAEYEYWNGFIREEVVEEIADDAGATLAVITRNHYGAMVLNTERVLFGDIDVPEPGALSRLLSIFGRRPRDKTYFVDRIRAFHDANRSFAFVVYETRAGLRFIISNREIRPDGKEVQLLFKTLRVDRLYTRLCRTQVCFRARLTPKPWRIGCGRPATRFPRESGQDEAAFRRWLAEYERASAGACAARRVTEIGVQRVPAAVKQVLDLHERYACSTAKMLA